VDNLRYCRALIGLESLRKVKETQMSFAGAATVADWNPLYIPLLRQCCQPIRGDFKWRQVACTPSRI